MTVQHTAWLQSNFWNALPPTLLELNLAGNRLTRVPRQIARLPLLRRLDLANNALTDITALVRGGEVPADSDTISVV